MIAKPIFDHLYMISLGFVNVFLVNADELTLIDTGIAGSGKKILSAIEQIGYRPQDLRHILITHLHFDHTGSLDEIKRASGAMVSMHQLDADDFSNGNVMRPVEPSPGLLSTMIVNTIRRRPSAIGAKNALVDHFISGDGEIKGTGGIRAVHAPGHTAGHVVYYWPQHNGVLFVGDAASNMFRIGHSILYEDLSQAQKTLAALGNLPFDTACFSHGRVIRHGAREKFAQKFGV